MEYAFSKIGIALAIRPIVVAISMYIVAFQTQTSYQANCLVMQGWFRCH